VTAADLEAVFAIYEATAAEGKWIGAELPIDRDDRLESWRRGLFEERTAVMLVAESDGRILGSASLSWAHHPCGGGVLDLGMSVARDHRGRGIGKALVRACIDRARALGAHKITLQVWPHNTAARGLYERFGFVEEGYLRRHWQRRSGKRWDAVVMGLLLDEDPPERAL
jgi:RimJ/RimL family protein N-acetyltransferase